MPDDSAGGECEHLLALLGMARKFSPDSQARTLHRVTPNQGVEFGETLCLHP